MVFNRPLVLCLTPVNHLYICSSLGQLIALASIDQSLMAILRVMSSSRFLCSDLQAHQQFQTHPWHRPRLMNPRYTTMVKNSILRSTVPELRRRVELPLPNLAELNLSMLSDVGIQQGFEKPLLIQRVCLRLLVTPIMCPYSVV